MWGRTSLSEEVPWRHPEKPAHIGLEKELHGKGNIKGKGKADWYASGRKKIQCGRNSE